MSENGIKSISDTVSEQQVAYEAGKSLIALGKYDEAKAEFSKVVGVRDSLRTDILAQRRLNQINEILRNREKPAAAFVSAYRTAEVGSPIKLSPTKLRPDLWFVGSAAAYRSLYSDRSNDPLSKLLRLAKPKGGEKPQVGVQAISKISDILIGYVFEDTPVTARVDMLIPVPSDKLRYQQRGYSIPLILAKRIAASCCIPIEEHHISIANGLPELRNLPRGGRARALKGAFHIDTEAPAIKNRSILIVDDVITTGSTLREIAKTLTLAGVSEVAAVTLAHSEN